MSDAAEPQAGPPAVPPSRRRAMFAVALTATLPAAERRQKSAEDRCIDCHAPKLPTSDIPHVVTAVHDIPRVWRPEDAAVPAKTGQEGSTNLRLFHGSRMSARERAEADRELGAVLCVMGPRGASRALPLLDKSLEAHPDDPGAWEAKGFACAVLGRPHDALAAFDSELRRAPEQESLLAGAGFYAEQLGRRDQAIAYYRRAIAVDPWRSDYFAGLAAPLAASEQWPEAETAARQALTLNPANTEARKVLIRCHHHARRAEAMRAEFETLLAFDPPDRENLVRWFGELR